MGNFVILRAKEFGVSIARCTNTGETEIVSNKGILLKKIPSNKEGILSYSLKVFK